MLKVRSHLSSKNWRNLKKQQQKSCSWTAEQNLIKKRSHSFRIFLILFFTFFFLKKLLVSQKTNKHSKPKAFFVFNFKNLCNHNSRKNIYLQPIRNLINRKKSSYIDFTDIEINPRNARTHWVTRVAYV